MKGGVYILVECDRCHKKEYAPAVVDDWLHDDLYYGIGVNVSVNNKYVWVMCRGSDWIKLDKYILCKECYEKFMEFLSE